VGKVDIVAAQAYVPFFTVQNGAAHSRQDRPVIGPVLDQETTQ
jgi:hypothetical protein